MHAIAVGSAADYRVHERPALPASLVLDVQRPDINCLDLHDELTDHPPIVFIRCQRRSLINDDLIVPIDSPRVASRLAEVLLDLRAESVDGRPACRDSGAASMRPIGRAVAVQRVAG